jgi:radical SAM protein with 4Fe4S-binding SPASM domain
LRDINKIDKNKSILNQIARKYGIEKLENNINKKSFIKLDNNKFINLDTIFEWPSLNNEEISDTGSCYGLIDQIAILVDATVVPCCLDQNGDINLGNIFENTMEDILNSNEAKNIINGFKENRLTNELCKKCSFRISKRM